MALVPACFDDGPYDPIVIANPGATLGDAAIVEASFDDVEVVAGRDAVAMPGVDTELAVDELYQADAATVTATDLGYRVQVNPRLAYDIDVTDAAGARSDALVLAELRLQREPGRRGADSIQSELVLIAAHPGIVDVDSKVLVDGTLERTGPSLRIAVAAE
ncbi:MAG: hypothetical protein H6708_17710 [Kofleriaceae bacterium]|nr:hypothetical protein [Kofleriaceae bacterium]